MNRRDRWTAKLVFIFLMWVAIPGFGQTTDFSGEWDMRNHEDAYIRGGGPPLGDYLGIPLNDAGRLRAETTAESIWGIPEFGCRPHNGPYQWRGAGGVRFIKEIDPVTRELTAYHVQWVRTLDRPIYLDGRPHPPAWAPHTWSGFSTGTWVGNKLVITTTHLKEGYLTRSGVQYSDQATMTEYIMRHDDYLTVVMILNDPIYLTEPFVQSTEYRLNVHTQLPLYPCDVIDENGGSNIHAIPHYLPGKNPYLTEWLAKDGVPASAARGGAETTWPEFRSKMNTASPAAKPGPSTRDVSVVAESPSDGEVHILPVQGNVYMLVVDGSNITASVGPDGVLLVDAASEKMSAKVLAAVKQLSSAIAASSVANNCTGLHCPGTYGWSSPFINSIISSPAPAKPIRYIFNTSASPDHTDGNAKLSAGGVSFLGGETNIPLYRAVVEGVTGADLQNIDTGDSADNRGPAAIVAHENVFNRMSVPGPGKTAAPAAALPTDTYHHSFYKLSQFFNSEPVLMYYQPAAHTDGDSIVYFRRSDVISAGNIYSTTSYPVIDVENGGSIQGEIDALNNILDLAVAEFRSQGGTWIIPGHGRLSDTADVAAYRNMVTIVRDRIQDMIQRGMTLAQIKAGRPTMDFDGRYGSATGPWTTDMFIEAVYRSLTQRVKQ